MTMVQKNRASRTLRFLLVAVIFGWLPTQIARADFNDDNASASVLAPDQEHNDGITATDESPSVPHDRTAEAAADEMGVPDETAAAETTSSDAVSTEAAADYESASAPITVGEAIAPDVAWAMEFAESQGAGEDFE